MDNGDILLFQSNYSGLFGWWAWIVAMVTGSKWTHVAILLKNPTYINSDYTDGIYVLESGSEKWENKVGVIVSPLDKILKAKQSSKIVYRKLIRDLSIDNEDMKIIYNTIKDKPYDINPVELIGNELKSNVLAKPRELDRFVCSSLVAYVYTALGLLEANTKWFFYQPWQFSEENPDLKLIDCKLGPEEEMNI